MPGDYYRNEKPYRTWDTIHLVREENVEDATLTTECGITFRGSASPMSLSTDLAVDIRSVPAPAKCGNCFGASHFG